MKLFPCGCGLVEHEPDQFPDDEPGFTIIMGVAECSFAARSVEEGGGGGDYSRCPNWGKPLCFSDGTLVPATFPEHEISQKVLDLMNGKTKGKEEKDEQSVKKSGKVKREERKALREQANERHRLTTKGEKMPALSLVQ